MKGAVVVVIAWYLDLQLSMQSIPITTDIVSSIHDKDEVTTLCNKVLSVTCDRSVVFSGFLHNIIEILLNTIKQTNIKINIFTKNLSYHILISQNIAII